MSNLPNILLRRARLNLHWDQSYVAQRLDVVTATVGRWERGESFPGRYYQSKLLDLFGMTLEELGFFPPMKDDPLPGETKRAVSLIDPTISPLSPLNLIGREALLEVIQQHLVAESTTLALHGLPGVGKTTLALSLTADPKIRLHFPDGILWAGLGLKPNLPEIMSRWGTLLGIVPSGIGPLNTSETWASVLRNIIGARRFLIIIDDVWDYKDAVALKVGGSHCAYIATTRSPQIAVSFAMQGAISVSELSEEDGITLLHYLVPTMITYDPEIVQTLVHSVGALPLALTLTGRYLQAHAYTRQERRLHHAVEQLLNVQQRLRLSEPISPSDSYPSLPSGIPLSLQSVIEVSDQHLDEQVRRALRALSIFPAKPNTFSEKAALAVSAAPIEALDKLSDAGLLEIDEAGRYTVHQVIADYARASLGDQDPTQRFVTYYETYVEENQANFEALEQESQNIFLALETVYTLGDHVALVQDVFALTDFLLHRGLYDLGKIHLQHAYEATVAEGDTHRTARALYHLGMIAQKQGEYLQATSLYEAGLASARQGEDQNLICTLLSALGWVTEKRGNYTQAEAYVQEGLILVRDINNNRLYGTLLRVLGTIADSQGNAHQAKACYQEALTIMRQYSDQEQCTILLINLGIIIANEGTFPESAGLFEEALAIARQLSHLEWQCLALLNLGALMRILDENQRAYAYCKEGLKIARQIGHREWQSHLLNIQAFLTSKLQGPVEAEPVYQEALALAREIDKPAIIVELLGNLGQIALRRSDLYRAAELFAEMMKTIPEGSKPLQAEALYNQGLLAAARGESQKAHDLGTSSLALFEEVHLQDESSKVRKWLTEGCQPLI